MPFPPVPTPPSSPRRLAMRGISLLELLVAMALGLIVVLAVMSVLVLGEANRRTTTGTNDMNQSGSFAATVIDRALRSAGAGFSQGYDWGVLGCKINASRTVGGSTTSVLPASAAFGAPFANLLGGASGAANLRVAPVLIDQGRSGGGSDILITMGGSAPLGDIPRLVRGTAGTQKLLLENTIGMQPADVLLLSAKNVTDCLVTQVDSSFAPPTGGTDTLPLGGTYYRGSAGSTTLDALAKSPDAYLTALGNADGDNLQLQMFGVGTDRILYREDLLNSAGSAVPEPMAEGVYALRALYGVDTTTVPDGVMDAWVLPAAGGAGATDYSIGAVMTTPDTMRRIVAVRASMLLRSTVYEKDLVADASYTLFADLPAAQRYTISLSNDDRHYRYRIVEAIVPLRNLLMKQPAS